MPNNYVEWEKSFQGQYDKQIVNASVDGVKDTLDDIGVYAVSRFGQSSQLGIKTGNLSRALLGRTGSIRKVTVTRSKIVGEIGTDVRSKSGFDYPSFHERGRYPFLEPATRANETNLFINIERRMNVAS